MLNVVNFDGKMCFVFQERGSEVAAEALEFGIRDTAIAVLDSRRCAVANGASRQQMRERVDRSHASAPDSSRRRQRPSARAIMFRWMSDVPE